ncbi:hypothetical protein IBTHAUMO2_700005 [Nitrosopumilaceae archaeon]|nr:hypothetical protein IBTHAUMO2_700005 [Nitrosopumilaceae archaeon]
MAMMSDTDVRKDRPVQKYASELHDSAIYDVLHRLEDELSTHAGLGRYKINSIITGIADAYEYWDSHDSAQTVPLMWDYIKDPRKYAAVKSCAPDDPSLDIGTVYTSRLLSQTGRFEEALELAEEDLSKWPDKAGPWLSKACALHGLGRPDEALGCAERALELRPENATAAGLRARILAGMGRYEEALEYAREYPHFKKRHFVAAMGLALGGLGGYREALVYLDVAISEGANTGDLEEARLAVIEAAGIKEPVAAT